jgi:fatty acid desaturase
MSTSDRRRHQFDTEVKRKLGEIARQKDNWHGPAALLEDAAVIAVTFALSALRPEFALFGVIVLGLRQRALATLLHEAAHQTIAANRTVCYTIGLIAGYAVFQIFERYRDSHCKQHHPHLGDPSRDPDLQNLTRQGLLRATGRALLEVHLLLSGQKIWPNLRNLIRDRLLPHDVAGLSRKAKLEYLGLIAFWMTIAAVTAYSGNLRPLLMWLLAYLTSFQTVNWLIELSEHYPMITTARTDLKMTRNRQGHWVEKFLTGIHGEAWHLVHHLRPDLPFWRLREAHDVMMADPAYRAANDANSGIFTRGPYGAPTILWQILHALPDEPLSEEGEDPCASSSS